MSDDREKELQQALAGCVLDSSWFYCVAGVGLAIPIGVRLKSYNPLVYLGLSGTLLDLLNGYNKCTKERAELRDYQLAVSTRAPRLCGLVGHARGAQARRLATGAGPDLGLGATLQRAVAFGPSEVAAFVRLTGDTNPIHQSLPAAQAAGFERCLVPGIMAASLFPALIGSAVPGALYLTQTLKFRAPVQVSEPMLASVTVSRISGRRLTFDTQLTDSAGAVRVSGSALAMLPPST